MSTSGRNTVVGANKKFTSGQMGSRWSLSFPFQFLIILVDSSFDFAGMIRIAKRRVYFLSFCFLFLLTHAWGALVQVDQVSSPAGHVNDSQVVEKGSFFQTTDA